MNPDSRISHPMKSQDILLLLKLVALERKAAEPAYARSGATVHLEAR